MSSVPRAAPIKSRTDGERRAWLAGFANAVNVVADHDLEYARSELRTLVEAEGSFLTVDLLRWRCPVCGGEIGDSLEFVAGEPARLECVNGHESTIREIP